MDQDPLSTMMQMVIPLDGVFHAITSFEVPREKHTGKLAAFLGTICLLSLSKAKYCWLRANYW